MLGSLELINQTGHLCLSNEFRMVQPNLDHSKKQKRKMSSQKPLHRTDSTCALNTASDYLGFCETRFCIQFTQYIQTVCFLTQGRRNRQASPKESCSRVSPVCSRVVWSRCTVGFLRFSWGRETPGEWRDLPRAGNSCGNSQLWKKP